MLIQGIIVIDERSKYIWLISYYHLKNICPKVYYAHIEGIVDESDIVAFQEGIEIEEDYVTQPSELQILNVDNGMSEVEVTIYEGKFHQVKEIVFVKRETSSIFKESSNERFEIR